MQLKMTHEMMIAGGAGLLTILLTAGPLFDFGSAFKVTNSEMRIVPRDKDLLVIPESKAISALVEDLSTRAPANIFTGKSNLAPTTRLPAPPAPPLELPLPPSLPLPEK